MLEPIRAMARVRCVSGVRSATRAVTAAEIAPAPCKARPTIKPLIEVVSAATVTGTSDAILHVLARDMRHLEAALERIRSSADIERSESIVVLSNGRVMEYGTAKDVLENPQNDYTVKLLSAVPRLRREKA